MSQLNIRKIRNHNPVTFTDLISLDSESQSDSEIIQIDQSKSYETEQEFQNDINKLKTASTLKFRNKWEEILQRYSKINDDLESDEIDLSTGEIIKDNGHLKSLNVGNHTSIKDVWSADFDAERDMKNARRRERSSQVRKNQIKQHLKAQDQFHINPNRQQSPTPTPTRKVSPDNILLLDPSPTKKQRISPTKKQEKQAVDLSPKLSGISDSDLEVELLEPLNQSTPTKRHTDTLIDSTTRSKTEFDPFVDKSSTNSEFKISSTIGKTLDIEEDFDEEYLIVYLPQLNVNAAHYSIYSCCFDDCEYTTGNREIFERHLLSKHRTELYHIGYPISADEIEKSKRVTLNSSIIDKVTGYFPLIQKVPPLPLSSDGKMFICGRRSSSNGRACRREFLSMDEWQDHKQRYPLHCSYKKQVHVCPVLGCGFMTEDGYKHYRQHFIDAEHHKPQLPKFYNRDRRNPPDISLTLKQTADAKGLEITALDRIKEKAPRHVVEEIDELFRSEDEI